jgi:Transcriptional repressor TCF25
MDPTTPENAPFFSALFRHMQMCSMLGCPSVAAEVGKLLLSLDPTGDRFNVLLTLDHFLVTAAKHTQLLAFMGLNKGMHSPTPSCTLLLLALLSFA